MKRLAVMASLFILLLGLGRTGRNWEGLGETGRTEITEAKLTHSKNLVIPKAEEKVISGWKLKDAPRIPKGWYLIKECYFEGINLEGYKYRTFKLARLFENPVDYYDS